MIEYIGITDGYYFNRTNEDVVNILQELKADYVYLGFRLSNPIPTSSEEPVGFFTSEEICEAERIGYTTKQLSDMISLINLNIPNVIICGGLGLEFFYARDRNPLTMQTISREQSWAMAFDPATYGSSVTKNEMQCAWAKRMGVFPSTDSCSVYDYNSVSRYYPDINNNEVNNLYLDKAKHLINSGCSSIWIDYLTSQLNLLYSLLGTNTHPSIELTMNNISNLVNNIHDYGVSVGRQIDVLSWPTFFYDTNGNFIEFPYSPPNFDGVVITLLSKDIQNMNLQESLYVDTISKIREKHGNNIKIILRIDLGFTDSPMHIFSQHLTSTQQKEYLLVLHNFCVRNDITLSYPVHGQYTGPWDTNESKILAYDTICYTRCNTQNICGMELYDAKSLSFDTYSTIKQLITCPYPSSSFYISS